jgi:hypothetical protein
MHTKFNRPDVSLHGPDDQVSYMEIVCTSSTVQTTILQVRTLQSLIMVITCSQSATVRTLGQHRPNTLRYFGHNFLLKISYWDEIGVVQKLRKISVH